MAASRDTTVANIKPLEGAIVRNFTAGAALVAGELCSMQSDGKVDPAITTAVEVVVGVALPNNETTTYADGDAVPVVVFGPVVCLSGATVGAIIYATDTAGEPGETAGTKTTIAGWAESATVLFVDPVTVSLA